MSIKRPVRLGALELVSLYSLVIVQPLYDLLGRQPTFLNAHSLQHYDLLWYLCGISIVIPASVLLGLHLLETVLPRLTLWLRWSLAFFLLVLLGFFIAPQLFGPLESMVAVLIVVLCMFAVTILLATHARVREGLRFAIVAVLVLPVLLVLQLPLGSFSFSSTESTKFAVNATASSKLPPVVMLVFDELPLTALLDSDLQIRGDFFPNFARLASRSDWYVQSSTVASRTRLALPALLTGQEPTPSNHPDAESYPQNLFSILAGGYSLNVDEPASALCVDFRCAGDVDWRLTAQDTAVLYAHIVTPAVLAARLPVLTARWSSFLSEASNVVYDERVRRFENWLGRVEDTEHPSLHFLHSLLPHIPYTTLPTTHRLFRHGPTAGHVTTDQRDELSTDDWADVEARYLFLWQLVLVDRMIGRVVERLEQLGIYDESLLVVTSDHGLRLAPGMSRRQPFKDDYIDIAAVPVFVKRPGQRAPSRIERPFHSTDLLPLMLETVGLDPAQYGLKKLDEKRAASHRRIRSYMEYVDLPETLDLRAGLDWWPAEEQVPAALTLPDSLELCANTVELMQPQFYQDSHPEHFLAAHVLLSDPQEQQTEIIVEFNGRLWRALRSAQGKWSAFVSPDDFQPGFNAVRVVGKSPQGWCLLVDNRVPG